MASPGFAAQTVIMMFLPSAAVVAGSGVSLRSLTCPSCHAKKVAQFAAHLQDNVLFPVPHRQYVLSIPKILRRYFLYDRKLLGKLSQCATSSLKTFFQTVLNKTYGIPGITLAIQTSGDYAKWHPHLHALVADGLFTESGYSYVMPKVDLRPLVELFRASVLKMLEYLGLLKVEDPKCIRAPPVLVSNFVRTTVEPYDDGWPEYEEPFIDVQTM